MRLSKRALGVSESETLRLSVEISRLRAAGETVVSLLEGEADIPAPPAVVAATAAAGREGFTRYSASSGLPALKTEICRKLERDNRIVARAENILVANGAKQALYEVLQALSGPGDEVLVASPYWVTFPEAVRLAGAAPVFAPLDVDALGRAVTSRTRALILNSPNNPNGKVCSREELRALVQLARRKDFVIISDEAYESLVFDGAAHVSPASLGPDAARRVVTVQTFSKSHSMTGFRVGYLCADAELTRAVARIHSHLTGNVCTFAQYGAIAALKLGRSYVESRRRIFEGRRNLAFGLSQEIFAGDRPQGGFYVFADARRHLRGRLRTSADLAAHLLKKAHVAVVPGSACGQEGFLRISFSSSEDNIREGFRRMKECLCP
jgi:aspartate aminotransferase